MAVGKCLKMRLMPFSRGFSLLRKALKLGQILYRRAERAGLVGNSTSGTNKKGKVPSALNITNVRVLSQDTSWHAFCLSWYSTSYYAHVSYKDLLEFTLVFFLPLELEVYDVLAEVPLCLYHTRRGLPATGNWSVVPFT